LLRNTDFSFETAPSARSLPEIPGGPGRDNANNPNRNADQPIENKRSGEMSRFLAPMISMPCDTLAKSLISFGETSRKSKKVG
jgi:hypothetical protein